MTFSVNVFASTADKFFSRVSYLPSHVFLRRKVGLLPEGYTLDVQSILDIPATDEIHCLLKERVLKLLEYSE